MVLLYCMVLVKRISQELHPATREQRKWAAIMGIELAIGNTHDALDALLVHSYS